MLNYTKTCNHFRTETQEIELLDSGEVGRVTNTSRNIYFLFPFYNFTVTHSCQHFDFIKTQFFCSRIFLKVLLDNIGISQFSHARKLRKDFK